ncbi:MAG: cupredoxin domain-containing protein [Actinomycetota bacterium]
MPKTKLLVLVTVLTLAAVACGGDNSTPSAGGTTQSPGTSPQPTANPINTEGTIDATAISEFSIELDDYYFKPTFIKVRPGQTLNIELEQEGANAHTFTITALNIDHQLIARGEKKEINLTLPTGTTDVVFFCRFHGSGGMRGAFFFGAAPSAISTPPEQDPY